MKKINWELVRKMGVRSVVSISIVASFVAGTKYQSHLDSMVKTEAQRLVQDMKPIESSKQ